MSGCANTAAKIVKVDSFCEGRYESLLLEKKDFDNIKNISKNETWKTTIDKYIDYHTRNEKEYEYCINK